MNFYEPLLAAPLLPPNVVHSDSTILEAMSHLRYPVWATLKKDGVRAIRLDGTLKSRTRKLIPNRLICERSLIMPGGFDVELWNPTIEFNDISGIVRTQESTQKEANSIEFHVLDCFSSNHYNERMFNIKNIMKDMPSYVKFDEGEHCYNPKDLFNLLLKYEQEKGEGICFRTLLSPYPQKHPAQNRSTLKEQYLVKYSRMIYDEAIIVGFEEQMENGNPEKRNATGKMKRQTNQNNMYPKGTLGALVVTQDICPAQAIGVSTAKTFRVAAGFTDRLRQEIWNHKDRYWGQQITFKHKPHGRLNKPRSPIFHGFREVGL